MSFGIIYFVKMCLSLCKHKRKYIDGINGIGHLLTIPWDYFRICTLKNKHL